MSVLGIDLGTTYSCVARCDNRGRVEILMPQDATDPSIPSVVSFEDDGTPFVGRKARNCLVSNSESAIEMVKREMNKEFCDKKVLIQGNRRRISPIQASACILHQLLYSANKTLQLQYREKETKKAVITVPAAFNDTQRERTRLAAEKAGIEVLALLQEPTAAAISYNIANEETILVFDLGGGTLDVSIVKNSLGDYTVLGVPAGDLNLGGKDWDEALVSYVLKKNNIKPSSINRYGRVWARLMQNAEVCKKELSDSFRSTFHLEYNGKSEAIPISRFEFELITADLVNRTIDIVKKAIFNAKNPPINRFVLVGGSSRMPMIQRALESTFTATHANGRPINEWLKVSDPDQAIAKGAARYAGLLSKTSNIDFGLKDKATHSYGFKCKKRGKVVVSNWIFASDEIVVVDRKFTMLTTKDNQETARIIIIENDSLDEVIDFKGQEPLLTKSFNLPKKSTKGTPIKFVLNRNKDGMINVSAKCKKRELSFDAKVLAEDYIIQQIENSINKMKQKEEQ